MSEELNNDQKNAEWKAPAISKGEGIAEEAEKPKDGMTPREIFRNEIGEQMDMQDKVKRLASELGYGLKKPRHPEAGMSENGGYYHYVTIRVTKANKPGSYPDYTTVASFTLYDFDYRGSGVNEHGGYKLRGSCGSKEINMEFSAAHERKDGGNNRGLAELSGYKFLYEQLEEMKANQQENQEQK